MNIKKTLLSSALTLGLVMSGVANAAVVYSFPLTIFEDDDLEFLIDEGGSQVGQLDLGDRLIGILEIDQTNGGALGPSELTGVFDTTIISKFDNLDGTFDIGFGSTVGGLFANADNNGGAIGSGTGDVVRFYLDNDGIDDLDLVTGGTNCLSLVDCQTKAGYIDSTTASYFSLGFTGDLDEIWDSSGVLDSAAGLLSVPGVSLAGTFRNALSLTANNTGRQFREIACIAGFNCGVGGDGMIDWLGSGTVLGGSGLGDGIITDGAFGRSDFDGALAPIPEPSSLALLGLGMLGLGFGARRKNAK